MVTITMSFDDAHADAICGAISRVCGEGNRGNQTEGKGKGTEGNEGNEYPGTTPPPAQQTGPAHNPGTPARK